MLNYEIHGTGPDAFLLLHNAGGNLHFFTPQIEFLKTKGQVVAVDLPGHGRSPISANGYTLKQNAKSVADLIDRLQLENITGIGLNYGANVLIELNSPHIKKLIMIDPPLFMDAKVRKLVQDHVAELGQVQPDQYAQDLVEKSFLNASKQSRQIALDAFRAISHEVLSAVYTDLLDWDKEARAKVQNLHCPALCIFTDASLCSEDELQACNPGIAVEKVVKSLYWATLEVPDQINAMIMRFCAM